MPAVALITWARMRPLLAAVTPRSWYLRKVRRPSTKGALAEVACTSLPVGIAALVLIMGLPERVTSKPEIARTLPRRHGERGTPQRREADGAPRTGRGRPRLWPGPPGQGPLA